MKRLSLTDSEQQELVAKIKSLYRYGNDGLVSLRTKKRMTGRQKSDHYCDTILFFAGKKRHVYIHTIVWALCHGEIPTYTIDHINGDRLDNRIENLREVSQSENNLNTLLPWRPNKDTGVAGVDKKSNSYRTNIRGRDWLFSNPYEAFYWAIACGKRYRTSPPDPSPKERGGGARR